VNIASVLSHLEHIIPVFIVVTAKYHAH